MKTIQSILFDARELHGNDVYAKYDGHDGDVVNILRTTDGCECKPCGCEHVLVESVALS